MDVIDTEIQDTTVADTEVDTGIDTSSGVKDGSELDAMLDRAAGIKPNEAKTTQARAETTIPERPATDANVKKPGEEGYVPPVNEQGNRQSFASAHTPRAYGKAFKCDAQGNVTLAGTGEIIATAGAARKSFDRMLPIISSAQNEADKYRALYESSTNANAIATQLKLAPEEYAVGARIMAAFKSDPKKAIAFLVSEAQNNGVDVSDLGMGGGGASIAAIEAALEAKVNKALEPFRFIATEREQQEQNREATANATNVVNDFIDATPDAEVHMDSIAKIMNSRPGEVSLTEAYWILNAHSHKHGFDWTRPLPAQIQARIGQTPNNGQPANNGRRLPDMSGRQNNDSIVARKPTVMAGDTSSSDIVKEAMREAGMQVDM